LDFNVHIIYFFLIVSNIQPTKIGFTFDLNNNKNKKNKKIYKFARKIGKFFD